MKRRLTVVLTLLLTALLLCSCSDSVRVRSADRTSVKIQYEIHGALMRCPHFRKTSDGLGVVMYFNGYDIYRAKIVTAEERAEYAGEPFAVSSNLTVYQTDKPTGFFIGTMTGNDLEHGYVFFMALEETDQLFIRFETDNPLGADFTTAIRYLVNGHEVVPDREGLPDYYESPNG